MVDLQTAVCRACGRKVKIDQLQFDSKTKTYVCSSCHAKNNPSLAPISKTVKPTASVTNTAGAAKPTIFGKPAKEVLVKYACPNCKFRFSRKREKEVSSCPYCGGNKVEEVTNDAQKILKDSDNYNF
jgi:protein-arginine kinase activator protein McsA